MNLSDFDQLPPNIKVILYNTHCYEIQSNVNKNNFLSICQYLSKHELPEIHISDLYQYIQLNNELQIPSITTLIETKKESWEDI